MLIIFIFFLNSVSSLFNIFHKSVNFVLLVVSIVNRPRTRMLEIWRGWIQSPKIWLPIYLLNSFTKCLLLSIGLSFSLIQPRLQNEEKRIRNLKLSFSLIATFFFFFQLKLRHPHPTAFAPPARCPQQLSSLCRRCLLV